MIGSDLFLKRALPNRRKFKIYLNGKHELPELTAIDRWVASLCNVGKMV